MFYRIKGFLIKSFYLITISPIFLKMKQLASVLILALPLLFFGSCGGSKKTTTTPSSTSGIQFVKADKLMPILDKAKNENKLVFVDIYTTWCVPCKMMERDVFSDKNIGNFFNDNFISMKIDAERGNGANIAAIFEVIAYPTLLFLDENGRILERKEGAAYHTELRRLADEALAKNAGLGAGM